MDLLINKKMLTNAFLALTVTFLALFLMALLVPIKAYAASAALSIPVEQVFALTPGVEREGTTDYVLQRLDSAHPLPEGAVGDQFSFTLTGNQQRDVGPITFIHAGLFSYEVRSDQTQQVGYLLDDTIYTIIIGVRNVGTGLEAEIQAIYSRTSTSPPSAKLEVDRIVFNTTYQALASDPELKVDPPVIKMVQGNPAVDHTFTFRLEAQNTGQPMPAGATGTIKDITIAGSGRAEFGTWSYTEAGVFVYTVREILDNNADYRFDTAVYTITDTVRSEAGQLTVDRAITNENDRPVSVLTFINHYEGRDIEVQEVPPPATPGTTLPPGAGFGRPTQTIQGPKTGDYADPVGMIFAMAASAVIALFTLYLIYYDRKSEREYQSLLTL